MRLIKTFRLAALAAVGAIACVGATSASATVSTELCTVHWELACLASGTSEVHLVLSKGTVGQLLSPISVLCLGVLFRSLGVLAIGPLANPQTIDTTSMSFEGCGTGSAHDNCTVTVEEEPFYTLLKTGLDTGSLEATSGSIRLVCSNIGINCLYDLEGSLFTAGANHFTANKTPTTELGGKFFCPDEGFLDGLLETLEDTYILH